MWGDQAADRLIESLEQPSQILDIGSGDDHALKNLCKNKHIITEIDVNNGDNWEQMELVTMACRFDAVWMCHSLEHMLNTHNALKRIHVVLKPGGLLAVTVPPLKQAIVGGHVTLWNAGLLLYRLVLAGFNCRFAKVKSYGYNISVITPRIPFNTPPLKYDTGDIETLSKYFPEDLTICQGFDGVIREHNW